MKSLNSKTNLFEKFENYKVGDLSLFSGGEPIYTTTSSGEGSGDILDFDTDSGSVCNGEPCDYIYGEAASSADNPTLNIIQLSPTEISFDPNAYQGGQGDAADG